MSYKELIEKQAAKQMPYKTPDGYWAIPRGWEQAYADDEDDVEGTFNNDYFRKEHKIPAHYKRIADDGMGNSTFVDTTSDESNPDFYDWDHETQELTKWDDNQKIKNYSVSDNKRGRDLASKMTFDEYRNIDEDKLTELGYYQKSKPTLKEKLSPLKEVGNYMFPGAVLGGMAGLTAAQNPILNNQFAKGFKRIGAGIGIGAGITGALGARYLGFNNSKGIPTFENQKLDEAKKRFRDDYWDGELDNNFMKQYQTPIEKKAGFFNNLNIGQKALGAATGALIGAPVGYRLAKDNKNSLSNKVPKLREANDIRSGKTPINTKFIRDNVGLLAANNAELLVDDDSEDISDMIYKAKRSLAKRNIDINNVKVKDFQSLINKNILDQYSGDNTIVGELSADDIAEVNERANNILNNNNNTNNIEKKAFFTEAVGTGIAAGIVGNGVGRLANGAHNIFTKQGRKDRRDYKKLIKDEGVKRTSELSDRKFDYINEQFGEILKNNPDITMSEISKALESNYKNEMMR